MSKYHKVSSSSYSMIVPNTIQGNKEKVCKHEFE